MLKPPLLVGRERLRHRRGLMFLIYQQHEVGEHVREFCRVPMNFLQFAIRLLTHQCCLRVVDAIDCESEHNLVVLFTGRGRATTADAANARNNYVWGFAEWTFSFQFQ